MPRENLIGEYLRARRELVRLDEHLVRKGLRTSAGLVVETGTWHGASALFLAQVLDALARWKSPLTSS